MEIIHLQHAEIDKDRWNRTADSVPGGSLYGQSWYLDAVSPGWEALATPDYSLLMPLTCRKKWGINYLYQPLLCQQLGVLSDRTPAPEAVAAFLEAIPARFRLIEITLNRNNRLAESPAIQIHHTYRLNLGYRYEELAGRYSQNVHRNLKKAANAHLSYETGILPGEFLNLLRLDPGKGSRILLTLTNRKLLLRLITTLLARHAGTLIGVRGENGTLLCALLMGQYQDTHYYLAPGSLAKGRETRAMFYLIDRYIHQHSGTSSRIDFEGSDIPSLARFYQGFGAIQETYPSFRLNRLPWPLNYLADRRIR